jgi:hypothetical protein
MTDAAGGGDQHSIHDGRAEAAGQRRHVVGVEVNC